MNKTHLDNEADSRYWFLAFLTAMLFGFCLIGLNIFGPNLSPDSGTYVQMAAQAREFGWFSITQGWYPPGYGWLLALTSNFFSKDFIESATLFNAISGSICVFVLMRTLSFYVGSGSRWFLVSLSLSFFFLKIALSSVVGVYIWSELPFTAAVAAGLFALFKWRTFLKPSNQLGIAVFFFCISWTIRFAGTICLPVLLFTIAITTWSNGLNWLLKSIQKSSFYLVLSGGLVSLVLILNKLQFGYWMRTSHPGVGPSFFANFHDFFGTLFGYFFRHPFVLHSSLVVFLMLLIVGLCFFKTWRAWVNRGENLKQTVISKALPLEWIVWFSAYSLFMLYLMTKFGIWGTNRFVFPASIGILVILGWILSGIKTPIRELTYVIVFCIALSVTSTSIKSRVNEIKNVHDLKSIWDSGIRGSAAFKTLQMQSAGTSEIFWLGKDDDSHYSIGVLNAFFPCKTLYFGKIHQKFQVGQNDVMLMTDAGADRLWQATNGLERVSNIIHLKELDAIRVRRPVSQRLGPYEQLQVVWKGCQ